MPDPRTFSWIAADAAAVNLNDTKTLLADGVSKFFINGKPADINDLKNWEILFVGYKFFL